MNNTRVHLMLPTALTLLFLFSANGFGQVATGRIAGNVADSAGAVIPEAKLVFVSSDGGRTVYASSNFQGVFAVKDVLPGTYSIEYSFDRLKYSNRRIVVEAGKTTALQVVVSYEANCPTGTSGQILSLSDGDRKAIVSFLLRNSQTANLAPESQNNRNRQKKVVLSLSTIKSEWVEPELLDRVLLLTAREVKKLANRSGDYLYLSFNGWHIGANCVIVTINNTWAVAENSSLIYLSGGGETYLFKKQDGTWIGEMIGGWVS